MTRETVCFEIDPYRDGLSPADLKRELGLPSSSQAKLQDILGYLDQDERQIMMFLFGLGPRQHGVGSSVATICLFHLQVAEAEAVRMLDLAFQKLRKIVGTQQLMRALGAPEGHVVDPHDVMTKAQFEPFERQIVQKLFMLSGLRKHDRADVIREFGEYGITEDNANSVVAQLMGRMREFTAV